MLGSQTCVRDAIQSLMNMAAFGTHFVTAFQADLQAIYSKYTQPLEEPADEIYLGEFCEDQTTDSDDSDDEDGAPTADYEDDGWESDASGPSYLEDLPGRYSSVSEGEEPDLAPLRNDTYILAKNKHCTEDMEGKDFDSETFISENEELQDEFSVNQQNSSENVHALQRKHQNSNTSICDATFLIDSSKEHPSLRDQGLSNLHNKPVSIVQPMMSSRTKLPGATSRNNASPSKEDYSTNEDSNFGSNCNTDLVKAVLCSRNKIALALAGITQKNSQRSSNELFSCLRSKRGKKSCSTGQTSKESSSTIKTDRESHLTRVKVAENNTEERSSVQCREPIKLNVNKRPNKEWDNKESNVPNSERCQPICLGEDRPRPFVTKSPPKTLKLKTDHFDKLEARSSPVKRKSATLCRLIGSSDGQGSNVEGRLMNSPIASSSSRALGRLSSNRNTLLLQSPASPTQPSGSPKSLRRRSSQLLRVNKDEFPIDSNSSVKRKGKCVDYRRSPPRKCQTCKGVFLGEGNEFHENFSPTVKHVSRDSTQDTAVAVNSSKKSMVCWPGTESKNVTKCENGVAKSNLSSSPVLSSKQKLDALMGKLKACKERLETSPVSMRDRHDHKPLSARNVDFVISNQSQAPPVIDEALEEKCESYPYEVKNRGPRRLSSTKGNGGVTGNSGEGYVVSRKNSSAYRDCVFGARKSSDKGNSANEVGDGELNYKQKVSSPFYIMTNKEHLSTDRPATSLHRRDVVLNEKGARTAKSNAPSPGGRKRNNIALSGDHGSNRAPLTSSPIRKRTARESFAMDTPDSLPRKQRKRSSPLSSCLEQGPSSFLSPQSLHYDGRQSTPIKEKKVQRLRKHEASQNMKLMSPIRRPVPKSCYSVQGTLLSPCKGLESCDKSFCFDCC